MNNTPEYLAATGQISVDTLDEIRDTHESPEVIRDWALAGLAIAIAAMCAVMVISALYFGGAL